MENSSYGGNGTGTTTTAGRSPSPGHAGGGGRLFKQTPHDPATVSVSPVIGEVSGDLRVV